MTHAQWPFGNTGCRRRGVEHETRLILDHQRIRVNGTDGYLEILP